MIIQYNRNTKADKFGQIKEILGMARYLSKYIDNRDRILPERAKTRARTGQIAMGFSELLR